MNSTCFICHRPLKDPKSVERGMVVMERDGKQSSSMNERDVLRFFATPGTVVRRLGKTVFKA